MAYTLAEKRKILGLESKEIADDDPLKLWAANKLADKWYKDLSEFSKEYSESTKEWMTNWQNRDVINQYRDSISDRYNTLKNNAKYARQVALSIDDENERTKYLNSVSQNDNYLNSVMRNLDRLSNYWNQWDSEEAYKSSVSYYRDSYNSSLEDWQEMISKGKSIDTSGGFLGIGGDLSHKVINDPEYVKQKEVSAIMSGSMPKELRYKYLNDEEKDLYNYIYGKEGKESAEKYLRTLEPYIDERSHKTAMENAANFASDYPILSNILSVGMTLPAAVEYPVALIKKVLGNNLSSDDFKGTDIKNAIRSETAKGMSDIGRFFYQTGMSMADTLARLPLGNAGLLIAGGEAASATMSEIKQRGGDDWQAILGGTLAGVWETGFEKLSLGTLSVMKEAPATTVKSFFLNILKQGSVEASEEAMTEIANIVTDYFVMGDLSNWSLKYQQYINEGDSPSKAWKKVAKETAKDVGVAALGGFVSGSVMSPGAQALGLHEAYKTGSQIENMSNIDNLADYAIHNFDKNTQAYKVAEQYINNNADVSKTVLAPILENAVNETINEKTHFNKKGEKSKNPFYQKSYNLDAETRIGASDILNNVYYDMPTQAEELVNSGQNSNEILKKNTEIAGIMLELTSNGTPESEASKQADIIYRISTGEEISANEIHEITKEDNISAKKVLEEKTGITLSENISESRAAIKKYMAEVAMAKNESVKSNEKTGVENLPVQHTTKEKQEAKKEKPNRAAIVQNLDVAGKSKYESIAEKYTGTLSREYFDHSFNILYNAAKAGLPYKQLSNIGTMLNEYERKSIYDAGKADLKAIQKEIQYGNENIKTKVETEAEDKINTDTILNENKSVRNGNTSLNETRIAESKQADISNKINEKGSVKREYSKDTKISEHTKNQIDVIERVAEATGINFVIFESKVDKNGNFIDENGRYDVDSNTIYIEVNAGLKNVSESLHTALVNTASHELTHFIRKWSPAQYAKLQEFLVDEFGADFTEGRIKEITETYARKGIELTYEQAMEELVANSCNNMLLNSKAVVKLARKNMTLAKKIKSWIDEWAEKVRAAFKGDRRMPKEAMELLQKSKATLQKVQAIWDRALIEATRNYTRSYIAGENDTGSMYELREYSDKQKENWRKSKSILVYENQSQLEDFIHQSLNDKTLNQKIYFGAIPDNLAERIFKETGLNVKDYNCTIHSYEIRKILNKSHGDENTELLRGQRAVTVSDILSIPEIIQNPDDIKLGEKLYDGKPVVEFKKTINGKTTVISYVSAKHKDLRVQTMYAGLNKRSLSTATDVKSPVITSETTAGTASINSISKNEQKSQEKYSIRYTTDNKPVVVIDEDILKDVPKSEWINTVKTVIKNKFSGGIPVGGRLIKVNRVTKNEYTNSKYSQKLKNNNKVIYKDKFKSASNLDDIILASTNYINEDLKHERNDSFKAFARGDVLIRSGKNDYTAKVIIGFTGGNSMILYDVIDFEPAQISIKKGDTQYRYAQKAGSDRRSVSPNSNILSQNDDAVNTQYTQKAIDNATNPKKFSTRENNGIDTNNSKKYNEKGDYNGREKTTGRESNNTEAGRDGRVSGQIESNINRELAPTVSSLDGRENYRGIKDSIKSKLETLGVSPIDIRFTSDAANFAESIRLAKENNPHGAYVTQYSVDDYKGMDLFISEDSNVGVALHGTDIVSVFKNPDAKVKRAVSSILLTAIENGGNKLDNFHGNLSQMYAQHGFIPVARCAFNEEFAPSDWNYERDGKPDIIFWIHNGDSIDTVVNRINDKVLIDLENIPLFGDYDAACTYRDNLLESNQNDASTKNVKAISYPMRINQDINKVKKDSSENKNSNEKFSLREKDSTYLKALQDNDLETAQKLVNEAAEEAFSQSAIRLDEDGDYWYGEGKLACVYHATSDKFNVFRREYLGKLTDSNSSDDYIAATAHIGFWFNTQDLTKTTKVYANSEPIKAFLNVKNPFVSESLSDFANEIENNAYGDTPVEIGDSFVRWLRNNEYDGVVIKDEEFGGYSFVALYSGQIKSANAVTYDDDGSVIALSKRFTSDSNDIRYQLREEMEKSDRELLAEALFSVAANPQEQDRLGAYKRAIKNLDKWQSQLTDINRKIKELSFAKGERDVKKIDNLKAQKREISRKLDWWDKRLIGLEAEQPIRDLIARERNKSLEKFKKEIAKAKAEGKQILSQKLLEQKAEYEARIKRDRERRHDTADKKKLRRKIVTDAKYLDKLLRHETDSKHIPEELKSAIIDMLSIFSGSVEDGDSVTYSGVFSLSQLHRVQESYKKIKENAQLSAFYDEDIVNDINTLSALIDNRRLAELTKEELSNVQIIVEHFKHIVKSGNEVFIEGKKVKIDNAVNNIIEELLPRAKPVISTFKESTFYNDFIIGNLTPVTVFGMMGDTLNKFFQDAFLYKAQSMWVEITRKTDKFKAITSQRYNVYQWINSKDRLTLYGKVNKPISLNVSQALSIYASSKRGQSLPHLTEGGIILDEAEYRGKLKQKKINQNDAVRLTEENLEEINNWLTSEQKAFADEMVEYLSSDIAEYLNQTSMELYGIKKFNEKNYFPIISHSQYLKFTSGGNNIDSMIEFYGFTKRTTANANNPIVIGNFMDVWANHTNRAANYASLAVPINTFERLLNYQIETADDKVNLRTTIANAYGKNYNKYIETFIKDINGGIRNDSRDSMAVRLTSLFKKSAVAGSLRVAVQQFSAFAKATEYINYKYFLNPKHVNMGKTTYAEMENYAPIAYIKSIGSFDIRSSQGIESMLKTVDYSDASKIAKIKGLLKDKNYRSKKFNDFVGFLPQKMDAWAWAYMWNATKVETANELGLPIESETVKQEAGRRITAIISATQVYDSVLVKSQNMRSSSTMMKIATAFMGEPTTNFNGYYRSIKYIKEKQWKKAMRAIGGVVAAQMFAAMAVSLLTAADDDDDKSYLESYAGDMLARTLDNINPLKMIPYVRDVISIFEGYKVERMDMSLFSDLYDAINRLGSDGKSTPEAVADLIFTFANFVGVPAKNVKRDIVSVWNIGKKMFDDVAPTGTGFKYAIMEALDDTLILKAFDKAFKWRPFDTGNISDKLYYAMLDSDKAMIRRYESIIGKDKLESNIRKGLKNNSELVMEAALLAIDGKFVDYSDVFDQIEAQGFKRDDIISAINSIENMVGRAAKAKQKGDDEEYEKAIDALRDIDMSDADIKRAVEKYPISDEEETVNIETYESVYSVKQLAYAVDDGSTDDIKVVIDDLMQEYEEKFRAKGKTDKEIKQGVVSSLRSSLTSYFKPLYQQCYRNKDYNGMQDIRDKLRMLSRYGIRYRGDDYSDWIKELAKEKK